MMTRLIVQTAAWLAVMAAILFLSAGDWRWLQGWIFLAELGALSLALSVWLLRHDPALLATRLSSPVHRDQLSWDRIFMTAASVVFIGWVVVSALDGGRFRWSVVPVWAQAAGAVLIAAGMAVVWQTFRANTFAAPQVRMQTARQQHTITDGPYRYVRHPMYAGGLILLLGMPLLLGSGYGLLFLPLAVVGIGIRAVGEERMLRRELPDYDAYARRVRFRLLPGVW